MSRWSPGRNVEVVPGPELEDPLPALDLETRPAAQQQHPLVAGLRFASELVRPMGGTVGDFVI